MKKYSVMAIRDFDYRGKSKKAGELFYMPQDDYELWGGFVRIVDARHMPQPKVTKDEPKQRTTATRSRRTK